MRASSHAKVRHQIANISPLPQADFYTAVDRRFSSKNVFRHPAEKIPLLNSPNLVKFPTVMPSWTTFLGRPLFPSKWNEFVSSKFNLELGTQLCHMNRGDPEMGHQGNHPCSFTKLFGLNP